MVKAKIKEELKGQEWVTILNMVIMSLKKIHGTRSWLK